MSVGYTRNNVDYIPDVGTETGFVNKAECIELIKQYTQDVEFYEIEPAEVVICHLDTKADSFPKIRGTSIPDLTKLGYCEVSLLHSNSDGRSFDQLVKPLSRAMIQYPVKGEIVNVAFYADEYYYSNPLNYLNKVNLNKMPGRTEQDKVSVSGTKFVRPMVAEEGDTVIQSRFGSTIHFGSDRDHKEPFLRISCGQNKNKQTIISKGKNDYFPHIPNINADGANIWMTTNEHTGLATGAPSEMKQKTLGGNFQTAIVSNADTQAINAREGDVSAFAQRNINLAAMSSINLESEFGEIKLGDSKTNNPMVLGDQLRDFLKQLVNDIDDFASSVMKATATADKDKAYDELRDSLKDRIEELEGDATFHSNKVFIRENHNPPDVTQELNNQVTKEGDDDELNLDSMWDNAVWEEIQDVTTDGYEVEKITPVAGVRG